MLSRVTVRASLVSLAALGFAPVLLAQSAREAVYYTTQDKVWRANLTPATPTSAVVATDAGASLRGLAVRYDGNGAVTLLAANQTRTGGVRAYSCPSATAACAVLGQVANLKYARAVALDTNGNALAVNEDLGGVDQLLYIPRSLACSANPAAAGCLPGGYTAPLVLDDKVDGASLLTDVKVVSGVGSFGTDAKYGPGDVLVLVEKPARILVYAKADIAAYLANPAGTRPVPKLVSSDFDCEEPENFGILATGELLVATARGRVLVFSANGTRQSAPFADLHDEAVGLAVGIEAGASDPVSGGHVLVTLRCDNRLVSLGITRNGSDLLAPAGGPAHTLLTNVAGFGVGDASVSGSIYTPASAGPLVVDLTSHEITFEKLNTPGFLEGNYYVIPESTVRSAKTCDCPEGSLTVEGITRCVPRYARGYPLGASVCTSDGTGCYYLIFSADTGANLYGGTQEHHFEEDEFGFSTACYVAGGGPDPKQPRVFWATDQNDPVVVEGLDFADITTGCNSHIGRGGQFSLFLTAWDARKIRDIVASKLENLERALNGGDAARGGLANYIDPSLLGSSRKKGTLAYYLDKAEDAWRCRNVAGTESALDSFLALIRANPTKFQEQPRGLPARNAPGELIARAESAWFHACGEAQTCQRRLTSTP